MANPTTNFNWTLPIEDVSTNWDAILNALAQLIDDDLFTVKGTADAALPVAGGTLTGNIKTLTATHTEVDKGSMSGAVTFDLATANEFKGTVSGAITSVGFSNIAASGTVQWFVWAITNGGAFAITWPAAFKWDGGVTPSLQATGADIVVARTASGGTTWRAIHAYSSTV